MTEGLVEVEQGSFRSGRGCADETYTLRQIGDKVLKKK